MANTSKPNDPVRIVGWGNEPIPDLIDGLIPVNAESGLESVLNTTTTPLLLSTTYTGTGEQNSFGSVGVSCTTDADGTLFFDFSTDGVNYSSFPTSGFTVMANIHEFHTAVKLGRYFRVRLVNGTSNQTFLRITTYYGDNYLPTNSPINQILSVDSDAIIVKAVDSSISLAFGLFSGMEEHSKFGIVKAQDAADSEVDIWRMGDDGFANRSAEKTFPTTAQSLYLSSDSISDTDVDVQINYLDSVGVRQEITVNTTGQVAVDVGVTALDCNRMIVTNENINVGNIYLNTANAHTLGVPDDITTVLAFIPLLKGQTQQAIDQAPVGYLYHIKNITAICNRASGAAGSADVELQVKIPGGTWVTKRDYPIDVGAPLTKPSAGLVFGALTQLRARVIDVSDNDTSVNFEWEYDLFAV